MSQTAIIVCRPCAVCGRQAVVDMPLAAAKAWQAGVHIQRAWPEADAGTRELLISGTHPACWDELWKDTE